MTQASPFPDARVLLRRYGLGAKKSWSQNFLVAERAFRAIVDATVDRDDDWIVEIGAGLGTLTARLAERAIEGKVLAVERERDMIQVLRAEMGHLDNVEIIEQDALAVDLAALARWRGDLITVCGNLPYAIASQVLFRIIDARPHISRAVVMIQREMADRLTARPGTKAYGALGVMLSTYADISTIIQVKPTAFSPPPKVASTVVRLDPLASGQPRVPITDHARYSRVVHAAFGLRRKTLRNALSHVWPSAMVDAALAGANVDGQRRGETLDIAELARLAEGFPPAADA
ncbi:MAG TPA: 16S rRNA (adenine(1518)-N(6)/adenine(1519)-N(6))-dimethyltransferase RsmA [Kofleriaceae bacterium]|nr:16S rRNA (adenine(1518)-N(6)/adenine(1519)-N(6))-dimethyltransferase RsmA [Kofleriaceae bacterium]